MSKKVLEVSDSVKISKKAIIIKQLAFIAFMILITAYPTCIIGEVVPEKRQITGYIETSDGSGVPGVTVSANNGGGSGITDFEGHYGLQVEIGWSGRVTPSKNGWIFDPPYKDYPSLTSDQHGENYTAYQSHTISGVIEDSSGSGIYDIYVSANNSGGSDWTDSSGYYSLEVPDGWTGIVTPYKSDCTFSPTSRSYSSVISDKTGENYTADCQDTHIISGYIEDSGGSGVSNVEVSANNGGGSDTTSSSGYYSIDVPDGWTGEVTPYKADYTFDPAYRNYYNVKSDYSGENYTASNGGPPPSITVISPNGGESWQRGTSHNITWNSVGNVGSYVKIELYKGTSLNRTITSSTSNDGSYSWTIPSSQTTSSDYKIKITSTSNSSYYDYSDNNFSITEQYSVTVVSPNGGESWQRGTSHNITWNSVGNVGSYVRIELYKGGSLNRTITNSTSNDGSYSWTVPSSQTIGSDYKIKIISTSNLSYYNYSDNYFSITGGPPHITVISPNGSEEWLRGTSHNITWDYNGDVGNSIKIQLYKDNGEELEFLTSIVHTISINDRTYNWIIPSELLTGSDYKIRIASISKPQYDDYSDANFTIPGIVVTSPNGEEEWKAGSSENITWTSFGNVGSNVKIDLYKSGILNSTIVNSTPNNGLFAWFIPSNLTIDLDYKVRITSKTDSVFLDESNGNFSIIEGKVIVFEDTFPSTTINLSKWAEANGARIDAFGYNEPSLNYSLRLDGNPSGGDFIESKEIDLSSYSNATLSYYYQQTGGGNPPRAEEDLIVDYYDGTIWIELDRQLGNGSAMTSYELGTIDLPLEAMHANFKLRIKRGEGLPGLYGDWFIDDIRIEISDGCNDVYPVKLIASDGEAGDQFGQVVSISGDYAIVGALSDDNNRGSAYIFECSSEGWKQQQKLPNWSLAIGDQFGSDVSISGNYAIVGAYGYDYNGLDSGSAYIFKRTDTNWTYENLIIFSAREEGDRFGCSVSIRGDYSIVGSYWDDDNGSDSGSAYIFQRISDSFWMEESKLRASDGAKYNSFGCSVSINGEYAIVGASLNDDSEPDCGAAYIFKRENSGWIQKAKLLALDQEVGDEFGGSVSISGNYTVIGAICDDTAGEDAGAAYIFERNGENWTQRAKLSPSDVDVDGDYFGNSVSIYGDYVVVGACLDDDLGEDSGAAYVYKREGQSWELQNKLTAPDGDDGDYFGQGVSISGSYVIVGSPNDDDNGNNSGSIYIFKRNGITWMP